MGSLRFLKLKGPRFPFPDAPLNPTYEGEAQKGQTGSLQVQQSEAGRGIEPTVPDTFTTSCIFQLISSMST